MATTAIASSIMTASSRRPIVLCVQQAATVRSFGTGARGARGLGWYQKYRDGRGGRHLQGKYWDRNVEELQEMNDLVFSMGTSPYVLNLQVGEANNTTTIYQLDMELATAALPLTCKNFQLLGDDGHYKDTIVHRIEKGIGLCLGDTEGKKGRGGRCHESLSRSGKLPETEPLVLSHLPGIVTMVSPGVDKVDSRFMLCTQEAPHLDGLFVGFGRLSEESLEVVRELEVTQYTTLGLPNVDLKIVACGPALDKIENVTATTGESTDAA